MKKVKILDLEKVIYEVLHGEKIRDKDISSFLTCPSIVTSMTPSKILFEFSELEIPENEFHSAYYIPTQKNEGWEKYHKTNCNFSKEFLLFVGTKDGQFVEYECAIMPPYIDNSLYENIMNIIRQC